MRALHYLFQLRDIFLLDVAPPMEIRCTDEAALQEYLAGLELEHLTGNYSMFPDSGACVCFFDTPQGYMEIYLTDHVIKVEARNRNGGSAFFYVPQCVDWDYLTGIIEVYPVSAD